MELWHLTSETPRTPFHVSAGEVVELRLGTYPIASGQATWVSWHVVHAAGQQEAGDTPGVWQTNDASNSYWAVHLGPFQDGDQVEYTVLGSSPAGEVHGPGSCFSVGPRLYLALLWHQHQPLYRNLRARPKGAYACPWVRLHALRDYYIMAARLEPYAEVHVTINLTPVLLWQIEDYVVRGASDQALDLTLIPARRLSSAQREELLAQFFEVNWHTQILPFPRYSELFAQRQAGEPFAPQDLVDLQMWFNLVWFAPEFQEGTVVLPDGCVASVQRFIERERGFTGEDIEAMVAEQWKILRNVVSIHRRLQERGQIEVSTTPFYHPILPQLYDTDLAILGRDGAVYPPRFHHPEDAQAQVQQAMTFYQERFGRFPQGMWPAEGIVGSTVVPCFSDAGVRWIVGDQGVLARSGQYGYCVEDANVLCRAYRVEDDTGQALSIFFRDSALAHRISFEYGQYADYAQAAADVLCEVKARAATSVDDPHKRIVSIMLDGANLWGAYRDQGRAFLTAMYQALSCDTSIRTVTFAEYLAGNPARRVPAHPTAEQDRVYGLAHASWADEPGFAPSADLATWSGAPEENRAWELVQQAHQFLQERNATPDSHPEAFASLFAAEGSDWFWWFGDDQSTDKEAMFDTLFRMHLQNVYRALRRQPPSALNQPLVPHTPVWTFANPIDAIQAGDRLVIRTNCPGVLQWGMNRETLSHTVVLTAVGGAMRGINRYSVTLGPFGTDIRQILFRFECRTPTCPGTDVCCHRETQHVQVIRTRSV